MSGEMPPPDLTDQAHLRSRGTRALLSPHAGGKGVARAVALRARGRQHGARPVPRSVLRGPFEVGLLPHGCAWSESGGGDAGARARARALARKERHQVQLTALVGTDATDDTATAAGAGASGAHVSYRQCKSALVPPPGWQPRAGLERSSRPPAIAVSPTPTRVWGYGFAQARGGKGLQWTAKGELVYFIGHMAVVLEPRTRHQRIFHGYHDGPITCLALDPTRRFAATGQRGNKTGGVAGCGSAYICVWDTMTLDCISVLGLTEEHVRTLLPEDVVAARELAAAGAKGKKSKRSGRTSRPGAASDSEKGASSVNSTALTFSGFEGAIGALCFSTDKRDGGSRYLIASAEDSAHTISVWEWPADPRLADVPGCEGGQQPTAEQKPLARPVPLCTADGKPGGQPPNIAGMVWNRAADPGRGPGVFASSFAFCSYGGQVAATGGNGRPSAGAEACLWRFNPRGLGSEALTRNVVQWGGIVPLPDGARGSGRPTLVSAAYFSKDGALLLGTDYGDVVCCEPNDEDPSKTCKVAWAWRAHGSGRRDIACVTAIMAHPSQSGKDDHVITVGSDGQLFVWKLKRPRRNSAKGKGKAHRIYGVDVLQGQRLEPVPSHPSPADNTLLLQKHPAHGRMQRITARGGVGVVHARSEQRRPLPDDPSIMIPTQHPCTVDVLSRRFAEDVEDAIVDTIAVGTTMGQLLLVPPNDTTPRFPGALPLPPADELLHPPLSHAAAADAGDTPFLCSPPRAHFGGSVGSSSVEALATDRYGRQPSSVFASTGADHQLLVWSGARDSGAGPLASAWLEARGTCVAIQGDAWGMPCAPEFESDHFDRTPGPQNDSAAAICANNSGTESHAAPPRHAASPRRRSFIAVGCVDGTLHIFAPAEPDRSSRDGKPVPVKAHRLHRVHCRRCGCVSRCARCVDGAGNEPAHGACSCTDRCTSAALAQQPLGGVAAYGKQRTAGRKTEPKTPLSWHPGVADAYTGSGGGRQASGMHEPYPQPKQFTFVPIRAAALAKADWGSKSDPYLRVYWHGEQVGKTKVQSDTDSPKWSEGNDDEWEEPLFPMKLVDGDEFVNPLRIEVWDKDLGLGGLDKDDFLGEIVFETLEELQDAFDVGEVTLPFQPSAEKEKRGPGHIKQKNEANEDQSAMAALPRLGFLCFKLDTDVAQARKAGKQLAAELSVAVGAPAVNPAVRCVAWSPDGQLLATAHGRCIDIFQAAPALGVCWLDQAREVANKFGCTLSSPLQRWPWPRVCRLGPMPSHIFSIDWSADGTLIRATCTSHTISTWDMRPLGGTRGSKAAYTVAFLDQGCSAMTSLASRSESPARVIDSTLSQTNDAVESTTKRNTVALLVEKAVNWMTRVVGATTMDGVTMLQSTPEEDEAKSAESKNQQYNEGKESDSDEGDCFDGFFGTRARPCIDPAICTSRLHATSHSDPCVQAQVTPTELSHSSSFSVGAIVMVEPPQNHWLGRQNDSFEAATSFANAQVKCANDQLIKTVALFAHGNGDASPLKDGHEVDASLDTAATAAAAAAVAAAVAHAAEISAWRATAAAIASFCARPAIVLCRCVRAKRISRSKECDSSRASCAPQWHSWTSRVGFPVMGVLRSHADPHEREQKLRSVVDSKNASNAARQTDWEGEGPNTGGGGIIPVASLGRSTASSIKAVCMDVGLDPFVCGSAPADRSAAIVATGDDMGHVKLFFAPCVVRNAPYVLATPGRGLRGVAAHAGCCVRALAFFGSAKDIADDDEEDDPAHDARAVARAIDAASDPNCPTTNCCAVGPAALKHGRGPKRRKGRYQPAPAHCVRLEIVQLRAPVSLSASDMRTLIPYFDIFWTAGNMRKPQGVDGAENVCKLAPMTSASNQPDGWQWQAQRGAASRGENVAHVSLPGLKISLVDQDLIGADELIGEALLEGNDLDTVIKRVGAARHEKGNRKVSMTLPLRTTSNTIFRARSAAELSSHKHSKRKLKKSRAKRKAKAKAKANQAMQHNEGGVSSRSESTSDASATFSLDMVRKLVVQVHSATGLRAADVMGGSDPYVRVDWHPAGRVGKDNCKEVGRTPVIDNSLDAVWNDQAFEICEIDESWIVPDNESEAMCDEAERSDEPGADGQANQRHGTGGGMLVLSVWDKDAWSDDFLGEIELQENELRAMLKLGSDSKAHETRALQPSKKFGKSLLGRAGPTPRGHVTFSLSSLDKLRVHMHSAAGLPAMDFGGGCDPYAVIWWRGLKVGRTRTLKGCNPDWNVAVTSSRRRRGKAISNIFELPRPRFQCHLRHTDANSNGLIGGMRRMMGVNETPLGTAVLRESPSGRYCGAEGARCTVNVHGWHTGTNSDVNTVSETPCARRDENLALERTLSYGAICVRACTLCKLRVQVVHCVGLANVNASTGLGSIMSGPASCDPFVVVWLGRKRLGETSVLWGSRKPLWAQTKATPDQRPELFEAYVPPPPSYKADSSNGPETMANASDDEDCDETDAAGTLRVEVWDRDTRFQSSALGAGGVGGNTFLGQATIARNYSLYPRSNGYPTGLVQLALVPRKASKVDSMQSTHGKRQGAVDMVQGAVALHLRIFGEGATLDDKSPKTVRNGDVPAVDTAQGKAASTISTVPSNPPPCAGHLLSAGGGEGCIIQWQLRRPRRPKPPLPPPVPLRLEVWLVRARRLRGADLLGSVADTCVEIRVSGGADVSQATAQVETSTVIEDSLSPCWDQRFTFDLLKFTGGSHAKARELLTDGNRGAAIEFRVLDREEGLPNHFIGGTRLSLRSLLKTKRGQVLNQTTTDRRWIELLNETGGRDKPVDGGARGELDVELKLVLESPDGDGESTGKLCTCADEAEDSEASSNSEHHSDTDHEISSTGAGDSTDARTDDELVTAPKLTPRGTHAVCPRCGGTVMEPPSSLQVTIHQGFNLPAGDALGGVAGGAQRLLIKRRKRRCDPYVRVLWNQQRLGQTEVVKGSCGPTWEAERFAMRLPEAGPAAQAKSGMTGLPTLTGCELSLQVYDWDRWSVDDFLGEVYFGESELTELLLSLRQRKGRRLPKASYSLRPLHDTRKPKPTKGDLVLSFALAGGDQGGAQVAEGGDAAVRIAIERALRAPSKADIAQGLRSGRLCCPLLQLDVLDATNLAAADSKFAMFGGGRGVGGTNAARGQSDPFVEVSWGLVTQQKPQLFGRTAVVNNTTSPMWLELGRRAAEAASARAAASAIKAISGNTHGSGADRAAKAEMEAAGADETTLAAAAMCTSFMLPLEPLRVEVWDKDTLSSDDMIGEVIVEGERWAAWATAAERAMRQQRAGHSTTMADANTAENNSCTKDSMAELICAIVPKTGTQSKPLAEKQKAGSAQSVDESTQADNAESVARAPGDDGSVTRLRALLAPEKDLGLGTLAMSMRRREYLRVTVQRVSGLPTRSDKKHGFGFSRGRDHGNRGALVAVLRWHKAKIGCTAASRATGRTARVAVADADNVPGDDPSAHAHAGSAQAAQDQHWVGASFDIRQCVLAHDAPSSDSLMVELQYADDSKLIGTVDVPMKALMTAPKRKKLFPIQGVPQRKKQKQIHGQSIGQLALQLERAPLLEICPMRASGLPSMDLNLGNGSGKSDPYCVVHWRGRKLGKTHSVSNDNNPCWYEYGQNTPKHSQQRPNSSSEAHTSTVESTQMSKSTKSMESAESSKSPMSRTKLNDMKFFELVSSQVTAAVYDKDLVGRGDFLGHAKIAVDALAGCACSKISTDSSDKSGGTEIVRVPTAPAAILGIKRYELTGSGRHVQGSLSLRTSWVSRLRLQVVCCSNLGDADSGWAGAGSSDPYVVVYWNDVRVGRTCAINNTLNPVWDGHMELFDLPVPTECSKRCATLRLEVWDANVAMADRFLGEATLSGARIYGKHASTSRFPEGWHKLKLRPAQLSSKHTSKAMRRKLGKQHLSRGAIGVRLWLADAGRSTATIANEAGLAATQREERTRKWKQDLILTGARGGFGSEAPAAPSVDDINHLTSVQSRAAWRPMKRGGGTGGRPVARRAVRITALRAASLLCADVGSRSDPFVVAQFSGVGGGRTDVKGQMDVEMRHSAAREVWRSDVVPDTQSPEWGKESCFSLPLSQLCVKFWDKGRLHRSFLGQVSLGGEELSSRRVPPARVIGGKVWHAEGGAGLRSELRLHARPSANGTSSRAVDGTCSLQIERVRKLRLWVRAADGLRGADPNLNLMSRMRGEGGLSDPYVVVYWNNAEVLRTNFKSSTLSPRWSPEESTVEILLPYLDDQLAPSTASLRIEIWDHDYSGKDDFLGGVRKQGRDVVDLARDVHNRNDGCSLELKGMRECGADGSSVEDYIKDLEAAARGSDVVDSGAKEGNEGAVCEDHDKEGMVSETSNSTGCTAVLTKCVPAQPGDESEQSISAAATESVPVTDKVVKEQDEQGKPDKASAEAQSKSTSVVKHKEVVVKGTVTIRCTLLERLSVWVKDARFPRRTSNPPNVAATVSWNDTDVGETKVMKDVCRPIWLLEHGGRFEMPHGRMLFTVWDDDGVLGRDFLGEAEVVGDASGFTGRGEERSLILTDRDTASGAPGDESGIADAAAVADGAALGRGTLTVSFENLVKLQLQIVHATGLAPMGRGRGGGTCPYAAVSLGGKRLGRTAVHQGERSPVWRSIEIFEFYVPESAVCAADVAAAAVGLAAPSARDGSDDNDSSESDAESTAEGAFDEIEFAEKLRITIEVFHRTTFGADTFLGEASIGPRRVALSGDGGEGEECEQVAFELGYRALKLGRRAGPSMGAQGLVGGVVGVYLTCADVDDALVQALAEAEVDSGAETQARAARAGAAEAIA